MCVICVLDTLATLSSPGEQMSSNNAAEDFCFHLVLAILLCVKSGNYVFLSSHSFMVNSLNVD